MNDLPTNVLLDRLADGWTSAHAGLAQELVQRWAAPLCNEADLIEVGENTAEFVMSLTDIRLRTMHEVPCLMIGGDTDLEAPLREFWRKYNSTRHLPFLLAVSERAHNQAARILHSDRCLILSAAQLKAILRAEFPLRALNQILVKQIPKRALIPFNLLIPAEGGMFFGREHELSRLCDEEFTSMALAGPGRIGKTSLTLRYKYQMLRGHHPRASRTFYINLYGADHLPDQTARFIAMSVQPSRRSDRVTSSDLVNFLRYQERRFGGPLELLIDEVDQDCQGDAFNFLGEAARLNLCRLVLCGRGVLMKMMLSSKSPLDCRLDLIQLGPLDEGSATNLLIQPLNNLGFQIQQPNKLTAEVLHLTGCLPNLVQFFGMRLVERAIRDNSDTISLDHLEAIKEDFITAKVFIKALEELDNPETKLLAISLLQEGTSSFTPHQIQAIAKRSGLNLDSRRINDICIDLVINNVLVWHNGAYRIANGGLAHYANASDYFATTLNEVRLREPQSLVIRS